MHLDLRKTTAKRLLTEGTIDGYAQQPLDEAKEHPSFHP
jgi:hypothetical protein